MTGVIGVAISTTGDDFRMKFLETCVDAWRKHLPYGAALIVTVDGDEEATDRAGLVVGMSRFCNVYRVGQGRQTREGHQGVAVNKNTGIELLMDQGVEHLFLCDDDTWPISGSALSQHVRLGRDHGILHNMVCWGDSRRLKRYTNYATWTWPRGVLLYAHRSVVETVGGMDERFGPGGHEHVEWSRRIHAAGLTPREFCSPRIYADDSGMGVQRLWHCADIKRTHRSSVRRVGKDWKHINKILDEREGDTSYVPYVAAENGRESATLWTSLSAEEPGRT